MAAKAEYWPNGRLKSRTTPLEAKTHEVCALHESWFENGQQQYKHNCVDDQLHGLCEWRYENGQQHSKLNYVAGQLHGLCEWWYEDGKRQCIHNYESRQVHGIQFEWDQTGACQLKYYVRGQEITKEHYDARIAHAAQLVVAATELLPDLAQVVSYCAEVLD